MTRRPLRLTTALAVIAASAALAAAASADPPKNADESVLGELPIVGDSKEHVTTLAILPSLVPDLEDVEVRTVVRRDFELTGMFNLIPDKRAPSGIYDFDSAVDVDAWRKVGAEVIVKVHARKHKSGKVEVFGLAYFLNVGKDPVYEKKLLVDKSELRMTAHRLTDALLGAITGTDGGFASRMTYSRKWVDSRRIFRIDSDGHDVKPITKDEGTALAPTWGPGFEVFYVYSKRYEPFKLLKHGSPPKPIKLPFDGSVYSLDFDEDNKKLAVAVHEPGGSSIYVGNADGSSMKKVSTTEIATHPVFSPTGKLAWVGGGDSGTPRRVYVDGKAVSPPGFTAAAPTFCRTDMGIKIVFSVSVYGNRQDLVMMNETGGGTVRLTKNMGSNSYPACSVDGRMLAFFRQHKDKSKSGLFMMSLKRWKQQRISGEVGESLRWAPLPPPPKSMDPASGSKRKKKEKKSG